MFKTKLMGDFKDASKNFVFDISKRRAIKFLELNQQDTYIKY